MTVKSFYYWFGFTVFIVAFVGLLLELVLALLMGSDVLQFLMPISYLLATGAFGVVFWFYGAGVFRLGDRKKKTFIPSQ